MTALVEAGKKPIRVEPKFHIGRQVGWAVWDAPPDPTVSVHHFLDVWRRPLGVVLLRPHVGHEYVLGWLKDDEDIPFLPSKGTRRSYFQTVYCVDCKMMLAQYCTNQL